MTPNAKPSQFNFGTWIRILGSILSTILFIQLIRGQDWDVVGDKVANISFPTFLFALALTFASYGFNVMRWCSLLWAQNVRVPYWEAIKISLGGSFASNFLPSTIGGDGFRMLAIQPYTKSKNLSIGSVVLDRIINMTAMTFLVPIPIVLFGKTLSTLLASAGLLRTAIFFPLPLKKLFAKYSPKLAVALATWSQQPGSFVKAFLYAWPSNLLPMFGTYLIARALGMEINFWHAIGVQTVAYFLAVIPISINGYGLREVAYTTLYSSLGISLEQASTLAIITRIITIISTLPGALWLNTLLALPQEPDEDGS